jgi:Ca2+-binding RTX toxin-like protein
MTDAPEPQFLTYDETYLAFMNRTLSPGHATGPTSFWDWANANETRPALNYSLADFHGFRHIGKGSDTKTIFFNIVDALSSSYISSSLQSVISILDEMGVATTTTRPAVPEGLQPADVFYTVNVRVDVMEDGNGSTIPFTNGGHYVDGVFVPPEEWSGANIIIDVYSSYGASTLLHEVLHAIGQGHTYCHGIDFEYGTEPDASLYLPGEASHHEHASNMRYTAGHTNQSVLPASLELLWRTIGLIPDAIHAENTTHTFDSGLFRENIVDTDGIDTLVVGDARYYDKSLVFPPQVFGHIINMGLNGVSFLNYGEASYASLLTIMGQIELPNGADVFTGSVIENLVSGDGHDTIWGNHVANDITAGDGNNLVYGLDGNDTLRSGQNNDEVYGGLGNDLFVSGSGVDSLYGGEDTDIFQVHSNLLEEGAWFDGGNDGSIDTVHVFGGSSITLDGDTLNGTHLVSIERLVLDWSSNEGVVDDVTRLTRGTQGLLVEMGLGSDTWSGGLTDDTVDGGGSSYTDTLQLAVVSDTVLFTGLSNKWSTPENLSTVSLTTTGFEIVQITGPVGVFQAQMANPASFPATAMTITFTDVDVEAGERVSLLCQGGQRLWIDGRGVDGTTTMRAAASSAAGMAPTGATWTVEAVGAITGGSSDDMILGGLGQTLHGGSGNDTLDLRLASEASGGAGADTFRWLPTSASTPLLQTITDAVAPPPYPNNPTSAQLTAWRAQVAGADSLVVTGLAAMGDLVWSDVGAGAVGEGSGAGALLTHTPTGRQLLVEGLTAAVAQTLLTGGLVGDWVGTAWADSPTAGGFTDNTRAFGLGGNDALSTDGGNVALYGGAGNDTLSNTGRSGALDNATLFGGAGNDSFLTSDNKFWASTTISYADLVGPVSGGIGGANGVVMGSNRTVTQDGWGGTDTLDLNFSVGNNKVVGSQFNDSMATISHGLNRISSMRLEGGDGNDTLLASGYNDQLYGGNGNDELSSASGERTGNFSLYGDTGDDKLWARGNASNDHLYGGSGNDRLSGISGGGDRLFGGSGNDLLITGSGSAYNMDTLDGGAGSDVVALISSSGSFGRTATINGFTPGVASDPSSTGDVWVVNADAAARYVHTNASVQDFARVVQVGADVHVGKTAAGAGETIAVFKGVLRADVVAAFGGVQSNIDAYWLARLGAASGGVSADGVSWNGESALGGDGLSMAGGGPNGGDQGFYTLPDGDDAAPVQSGLDRAEWLEMEAQAHEDLLAGLNASGTTEFLFKDPTWTWIDAALPTSDPA